MELVDVETLSSDERLDLLTKMRVRQQLANDGKGDGLNKDEMAYAMSLIRVIRGASTAAKGRKALPTPTDLSAF